MGYKNLNKVFVPRVIPMAEEVTRSKNKATSMARYQGRSYCRERVSGRRVSPDITEGMVATTTFNAFHQNS